MGIPTLEPDSERARRSALLALDVLDTAAEPVFDALARLAARLLAAPIALVSLVDADRQWFKANVGLDGVTETPRDVAFCDHAIRGSEVLVVPDAAADPRFEANPLVTAAPGIRFYAGAPLELEGGHRVGTLCVIDRAPRALGDHERDVLVELAACVTEALVMRRAMADGRRAADAITALDARLHRALAFQERSARLAGVGGWELDLATGEMVWGFGVRRILAVDDAAPATLDGLLAFFEPEIREPARGWLAAAAGAEPRVDSERWLTSATGDRRLVRVVGHVEPGPRGPRLVGAMQDVTEHHRLSEELARAHEVLRMTLESLDHGVVTTREDGRVRWLNPAAERLTGWRAADAVGEPLDRVVTLVDADSRAPIGAGPAAPAPPLVAERLVLVPRAGADVPIALDVAPIARPGDGAAIGSVVTLRDVSRTRRQHLALRHRAEHDALTGLANRVELDRVLAEHVAGARRDGVVHCLLVADLDRFKQVNDAAGHAAGDRALREIAALLAASVRATDVVARLGGDEFAILLPRCSEQRGREIAQTLCDRVATYRLVHGDRAFTLGLSVGLAVVDARYATAAAALAAADGCAQAAKAAGRGRVRACASPAATAAGGEAWADRITHALAHGGVSLRARYLEPLGLRIYQRGQPLRVLVEPELTGADAEVLRGHASRLGLAGRLDLHVVGAVLRDLERAPTSASAMVELSSAVLTDPDDAARLRDLLVAAPWARAHLWLGLGEEEVVSRLDAAAAFIDDVRALGCRVALLRCGEAGAAFGHLRAVRVDALALSARYGPALDRDAMDRAVVRCYVDVAGALGIPTVVAGLHRDGAVAAAAELGVDFALGAPEPTLASRDLAAAG